MVNDDDILYVEQMVAQSNVDLKPWRTIMQYDGIKQKKTISEIAEELNLSKTTVSRAISGKGRIGESTRLKVLDYIRENGYKPNVSAKKLAMTKTYNLAVVLPSDSNAIETPFFQKCLMGVCEVAASHDYDVVVTTINDQDRTLLERIVNNRKVDGVVLTRTLVNDLSIEYLKKSHMPFVVLGSSTDSEVIQIDNHHLLGCKELTNYLLVTDVQSIGLLVGNQNYIVNRKRYMGYREAIESSNQVVNDELVYLNTNTRSLIDRAVDTLMKKNVDCILTGDDVICSRVLSKLNEEGYEVPKDVKVASFYNSPFLESHNPPITTLDFDVHELGNTAADRIIELIETGETETKTLLDYKIVLKTSTQQLI